MLVNVGLKFYAIPSRLAHRLISQYLLNMMDQVDTLHVDRYWSQVLCCTIMTHLDDLEVKVMVTDLEIWVNVLVKVFVSLYLLNM